MHTQATNVNSFDEGYFHDFYFIFCWFCTEHCQLSSQKWYAIKKQLEQSL